jgi:short-subunit dehydrogenase
MSNDARTLHERYGEWALVTGASAGIGLEFARALAREGVSCVLTARREDRLTALAAELREKYKIETRVVAADLAAPDGADRLAAAVADLPIAILVNNAGFGYAGRFDKLETERLRAMVRVNCEVPVVLTSRILPGMIKRGRGAVIIVGSVAGRQPLPLHAVYSATKGFDLLFGEGLWGELRGTGIDALVIEPGPTATEFQAVAGEAVGADHGEPAENVVRVALGALGRKPSVISGWFNWARANAIRLVPRSTAAIIAKKVVQGQTPPELR